MKNVELTYSPYSLELKKPFFTSKSEIKKRDGFIIKISDTDGFEGIGDACPFPEFGSESYDVTSDALSALKLKIKIDESNIYKSIDECLKDFDKLPALQHGLEQAILNLICNKNKTRVDKFLKLNLNKKIIVNGTIGMLNSEETIQATKTLVGKGFSTVKVKVGRDNFNDDFETVKSIRNEIGKEPKLRIDINGEWIFKKAVVYLRELEEFDIEYAEQPVSELRDYKELKKESKIPLAADESIRSVSDAEKFINSGAVSYIVLKPMLLGGLLPTIEIIKLAESKNVTPVITSSFESAIGRTNVVIAAACVKADVAHGLAVNDYFKNDLMNDPYQINSGTITLQ